MKNKLAKSMSMIIAIAMLISMVPAVVSAESDTTIGTVTGTIGTVDATGSAKVTVEATGITGTMTDYTLLAIRSTEKVELADLSNPATTDAWLEERIEYIDQGNVTDQGVTYDADEGTLTLEFTLRGADLAEMKTRTSSYGDQITVLLGGTNVVALASEADTYQLPNEEAPTLSITNENKEVWAGGAVVLNYSFANDTDGDKATAWEAATKTVYVDGVEKTATIDGGTITFAEGTLNVGKYEEIEITAIDATTSTRWNAATLGTAGTKLFEVKSRVAAAKNELWKSEDIKVDELDTDNNNQLDTKKITVKNSVTATSGATIEYTVVTEAIPDVIAIDTTSETETVVTVTRSADAAIDVEISALISYGTEPTETATQKYTANKLGEDGPTFTADDVTILKESGAYGDADKALIKFKKADVTGAASFKVGEADLYWSPQKEAFYGVIAASVITGETDEAKKTAVANALKAGYSANEASETFYFGVAIERENKTEPNNADFGYAGRITKGTAEEFTIKKHIAMDVNNAEPNGLLNNADFGASGRKTKGTAFPVLSSN